ncbi:MAG TPA: hypothetical protein PKB12_05170 [Elusimicrobiota bacterium]|nr:hypothetical protein [Elusimicrobiota bacterium]
MAFSFWNNPIAQALRRAIGARADFLALKLVVLSEKISPTVLDKIISNRSGVLANRLLLKFLDTNGYLHCAVCSATKPLRNVGNLKSCESHVDVVAGLVKRMAA